MISMKNDNELIEYFGKTRNIKQSTLDQYKIYLKEYSDFNSMTLTELLEEAEQEEEIGKRWKYRSLKKRLIEYRTYLYDKHSKLTAKQRFIKIQAFYTHFDIEIHNLPKFNEKNLEANRKIAFTDLLTKEELRNAIDVNLSPIIKPLILFMASSGCARAETLSLTVEDYINATKNYHNGGNIEDILETLSHVEDVIPTWNILRIKTNKYYTTFSSPESTKAINIYLQGRQDKLTLKSKLFKISEDYIVELFIRVNDTLGLGYVGKFRKLRTHMLRKFHASSLMNDGMSRELVNDLEGRTKSITDEAYFFNNEEALFEEYVKHLPAVTIMEDVKKLSIKSPEFVQIENENKELKTELDGIKADIQSIKKAFESK